MKIRIRTSLVLIALLMISCVNIYGDQKNIVVYVSSESGSPVSQADVTVAFDRGGSNNIQRVTKKTDSNGFAEISGSTPFSVPISVSKEGYYRSGYVEDDNSLSEIVAEIELREIRNPLPMYVKSDRYIFPSLTSKSGFDLKVGDWVAPWGEGQVTDLYFFPKIAVTNRKEYSFGVDVSFPNSGDGLFVVEARGLHKHSSYRFPYLAPESEYLSKYTFSKSKVNGKRLTNIPNAIVRTRTKLINGEVVEANYSKFYPEMLLTGVFTNSPGIQFTHYFNPRQNERSMEFDVDQNLASESSFLEP